MLTFCSLKAAGFDDENGKPVCETGSDIDGAPMEADIDGVPLPRVRSKRREKDAAKKAHLASRAAKKAKLAAATTVEDDIDGLPLPVAAEAEEEDIDGVAMDGGGWVSAGVVTSLPTGGADAGEDDIDGMAVVSPMAKDAGVGGASKSRWE